MARVTTGSTGPLPFPCSNIRAQTRVCAWLKAQVCTVLCHHRDEYCLQLLRGPEGVILSEKPGAPPPAAPDPPEALNP